MIFRNSKEKLTNEDIVIFEKNFKLQLPKSYIKIILEYNGGFPDKSYFKGFKVHFSSIKYGKYPIEKSFELLKDVLPKSFLSFGNEGGGWLFCFDLNEGENYGKVYLFQSDGEYHLLTNSFEEFMKELTDDPDE